MGSIGFTDVLKKHLTWRQVRIAQLLIVSRAPHPASEAGTAKWAAANSGLLKLLGIDRKEVYEVALHRAADLILGLKDELERAAFPLEEAGAQAPDPLGLDAGSGRRRPTTFFLDLANTYFEGQYEAARPAKRGFSKEKRSDCKLVGLAAACDRNGTVLKTQLLPGNVSEPSTLKDFLAAAGAAPGDMVVADEGIATEDNLKWLEDAGFHYIVADRRMKREFDESLATVHGTASGRTVRAYRAADEAEPHRIKIACHSEGRESKEVAMLEKMLDLYESELKKLRDGLSRPGTVKNADRVSVRLGRLAERYGPVGQYVEAEVVRSEKNPEIAVGVKYARREVEGSKYDLPGVYNIITNDTSLSDLEILKTYFSLTTIEAVFKALKGELGLRPVYHKKDGRVESHIFISTLAYQLVNGVRRKLMAHGINDSWDTIRENQGGAKVYLHGRQVPRRR
jgi:transposase